MIKNMFLIANFLLINCDSADCPNVINLARGLNMSVKQPEKMAGLQSNCCTGYGILCSTGRVVEVSWFSLNLNGKINSTAIPNGLKHLDLGYNSISGYIPNILPKGLTMLHLENNFYLQGNIPKLPSGLNDLALHGNHLNGNIPQLPSELLYLKLDRNALTGELPTLPNKLIILEAPNNLLIGRLQDNLPENLVSLILYDNYFSGPIPFLPASLKTLYVGHQSSTNNKFTGEVRMKSPSKMYIAHNLITMVSFENLNDTYFDCDISYNPLLKQIYDADLNKCLKTGLYYHSESDISFESISASAENLSSMDSAYPDILTRIMETPYIDSAHSIAYSSALLSNHNTYISKFSKETLYLSILRFFISLCLTVFVLHKAPFSMKFRAWKFNGGYLRNSSLSAL